jgi:hypothetical protein
MHYICDVRIYKLLNNGGWEGRYEGERAMEGAELTKVKYTHRRDTVRNSCEH